MILLRLSFLPFYILRLLIFLPVIFFFNKATAQQCSGSLGDPVVNITFGSGTGFGAALSAATTQYQYVKDACPVNGYYTLLNKGIECNYGWHILQSDHTGNPDGYFMLIDAAFDPSDFYLDTVKSLCANTTYEFAAWMLNLKFVSQGTRPNITFNIETLTGQVLQTYNSGDIPVEQSINWKQYGFYFTTPMNVSSIVLHMTNNANGGDGNDLALDDITFRPAGPAIATGIVNHASDTIQLCMDDTSTLHFTATVGTCYSNTAYQWQVSKDKGNTWNNITGATGTIYARPSTVAGNYFYRIIVAPATNIGIGNCRVASNPILVEVNGLPVISASNNAPKCAGEAIVLTASGGSLFKWTGPNGFIATSAQDTIFNSNSNQSGKYVVTVTDSFGCKKNDSTFVTVYARPVALFSVSSPGCENNNIIFSNQSVDGGQPIQKWAWDFGDGSLSDQISPTHVFAKTGTYPVSLLAQNDKGCKSIVLVKQVAINPLPKPDFILPAICLADPFATFINTSAIADNSETQFVYAWDFGDNNASPGNSNTSVGKSPQHSYTSIGVYPVLLTVTSKDGCIKARLKNFTVNGSQPLAKFIIEPTVNFCSNESVSLTNASTVNFGSISRVELYWDYGNNSSEKIADSTPAPGKKYTHQYLTFGTPLTRPMKIRYVVYSGISCVNEATKLIDLKAIPAVQFSTLNNVCEAVKPYVLTQAREINGLSGTGIYSGPGVNVSGLFNPKVAAPGIHTIRFTFLGSNNCTAFATQSIKVFQQPTVNAGKNRTMLRGGLITLDANATGNGLQYEWMPNTNINNHQMLKPAISPLLNTTYTLTATSTDGCKATDEVIITVLKDIYVPSAFSPNGDGINDVWHIPYLDSYSGTDVKVFNRYGELVYEAAGRSIAWDGKYKGKPLPSGSYVWALNAGALNKLVHGTVMIVR